jgi:hypothetical protein
VCDSPDPKQPSFSNPRALTIPRAIANYSTCSTSAMCAMAYIESASLGCRESDMRVASTVIVSLGNVCAKSLHRQGEGGPVTHWCFLRC